MFFENQLYLSIVILLVLIIALLYDYITKFFSYWYVRHIVYKTPYPCFGSDLERVLGIRDTTDVVKRLYLENPNEKFIGYIKGRIPDIIVRDLDVIKLILSTDFAYFNNKGLCLDKSQDICLKNNLFYAEGEKWSSLREIIEPVLKQAELLINDNVINDVLIHYDCDVNVSELLKNLMDKYLINFIYGDDMKENGLVQIRKILQKPSLLNTLKSYMKTIFPSVYILFGMTTLSTRSLKHDGLNFGENIRNRFQSKFMNITQIGSDNFNKDNINEILSYIIGIITEAYIPCYNIAISIIYELAKNSQFQNKARIIALSQNERINIENYDYLDNIIMEAMRLYPPYSIINRKCVKAYKILETNILIDKGITVTIPVEAIHRDSQHYPEPDRFDPERFTDEIREKRHPYAYIPYGAGPRKCPGM